MFVINFKKGMAHPFLDFPLSSITNSVIDGDLILNKIFLQIRDCLLNCPSIYTKFTTTENTLLKYFGSKLKINSFIDFAVTNILTAPETLTIKNIVHKTGYSSKHFIDIFKNSVGVAPKSFLRIIRFQKAIAEIEKTDVFNWANLAAECGYYDQAHFINDFKNFSGFTPTQYLEKKNSQLNYIPVA